MSIVDNFGILAYILALIADNFGVSAHIQVLIADNFGTFSLLSGVNCGQFWYF